MGSSRIRSDYMQGIPPLLAPVCQRFSVLYSHIVVVVCILFTDNTGLYFRSPPSHEKLVFTLNPKQRRDRTANGIG
jgi:hypothetical protein